MEHVHGPNCGCKDYLGVENANDLFGSIDLDKVRCLNQKSGKTGNGLFRDNDQKFLKNYTVLSECDGELLIIVPFLVQVKVRSICIIAKDELCAPTNLRLYLNIQNVDFSITEGQPVQQFLLGPNLEGLEHEAVNPNKFGRVQKLLIHIKNPHIEEIGISYIQIKGQSSNIKRQAVQAVYQLKPTAQRNDLKDISKNSFQMG